MYPFVLYMMKWISEKYKWIKSTFKNFFYFLFKKERKKKKNTIVWFDLSLCIDLLLLPLSNYLYNWIELN